MVKHCTNPKCQPFCKCKNKCDCEKCQKYRGRYMLNLRGTDASHASVYQKGGIKFESASPNLIIHAKDEGNFVTTVTFENREPDTAKKMQSLVQQLIHAIDYQDVAIKKQKNQIETLKAAKSEHEQILDSYTSHFQKQNSQLETHETTLINNSRQIASQSSQLDSHTDTLIALSDELLRLHDHIEEATAPSHEPILAIEGEESIPLQLMEGEALSVKSSQPNWISIEVDANGKSLSIGAPLGETVEKHHQRLSQLEREIGAELLEQEELRARLEQQEQFLASKQTEQEALLERYEGLVAVLNKSEGDKTAQATNYYGAPTPTGQIYAPAPTVSKSIYRVAKEETIGAMQKTVHGFLLEKTAHVKRIIAYGGCWDPGDGRRLPLPYWGADMSAYLFINEEGMLQLNSSSPLLRTDAFLGVWVEFTY